MTFEVIILGIILVAICGIFLTEFLRAFYHKRFKKALLYKGLASACFIIQGLICLLNTKFSVVNLLILIGLCLGIVGDEIIALCQIFPKHDAVHFIGGGAFFIIGHLFYMAAMLLLHKTNYYAMAACLVVLVLLCVIYENQRKFLVGKMKNSLKLYIAVILLFTALGVGTFFEKGTLGTALFALGGALFTISDNVLFAFKFGNRPRYYQNVVLHIAYYAAQFTIAFSIACL